MITDNKNSKTKLYSDDYDVDKIVAIDINGLKFSCSPRIRDIYLNSEYEQLSIKLFKRYLKEDSAVIDVGAHYGLYSVISSEIASKGNVYSIEPVLENFKILEKNIAANECQNIKAQNIAISNKKGITDFHIANASDSSSISKHPLTETIEIREVEVNTLDNLYGQEKIDIVKIDTEGNEINVLEGMKEIIKNNKTIKLFIEFNPKCLLNAGFDPKDLFIKLDNLGLDIFVINDKRNKLYKIKNFDIWNEYLEEGSYVNLFCAQKYAHKLLYFLSHMSQLGGSERSLIELVKNLPEKYIVNIVFPSDGIMREKLSYLPISWNIINLPWWTTKYNNDPIEELELSMRDSVVNLIDDLVLSNPDLLYTNTSVIPQGLFINQILGIPHIYHVREFGSLDHGLDFFYNEKERLDLVQEGSNKVIFNSNALRNYYIKLDKRFEEKSEVIYNGIPISSSLIGHNKKHNKALNLIMLGNIAPGKGQYDAIRAVHEIVLHHQNNITLSIYGHASDQEYYTELLNYITKNNLQKNIVFKGFVEDVNKVLSQADILLMCSKNEAFGRVTIEAMRMGVPVIGNNSGGTTELIKNSINGFLYNKKDENDYSEIVKLLIDFIRNPKLLADLKRSTPRSIEDKFTTEEYISKIQAAVDRVIEGERKNGINKLKAAVLPEKYSRYNKRLDEQREEINLLKDTNKLLEVKTQEMENTRKVLQNEKEVLALKVNTLQESIDSSRTLKLTRFVKKLFKRNR